MRRGDMKIRLNNRETELPDCNEINIHDFLIKMRYTFPMIIIKINKELVKKEDYRQTIINEGDTVEAIHLIGGG